MERIKVKIHEYDEETHSLIVSFASDDNELGVDEYRKYAFSISNYNPDDLQETIYAIAVQGLSIVNKQKMEEEAKKNNDNVEKAKLEVNKVYDFDVKDLIVEGAVIT